MELIITTKPSCAYIYITLMNNLLYVYIVNNKKIQNRHIKLIFIWLFCSIINQKHIWLITNTAGHNQK